LFYYRKIALLDNRFQSDKVELDAPRKKVAEAYYARYRNILEGIESIFQIEKEQLSSEANRFIEDSRRATTDASTRERRAKYIIQKLLNE